MKFFSAALFFSVLIYEVYSFQGHSGIGKLAPKHLEGMGNDKFYAPENFNEHRFLDKTKWNKKLKNFELKNLGENNVAKINDELRGNEITPHYSNAFRDRYDAAKDESKENVKLTYPKDLLLKMMKYEPQSELGYVFEQLPNRRRKRAVEESEPPPKGSEPTPEGSEPPPKGSEPTPEGSEPPPKGSEPPPKGSEPPPKGSEPPPKGSEPTTEGSEPPPKGSESTTEGSEPTTEGSEPTTEGSEPTTEGSEPPSKDDPPKDDSPKGDSPSTSPEEPNKAGPPGTTDLLSFLKGDSCPSHTSKLIELLKIIIELKEKLKKAQQDKDKGCGGGGSYYDYYVYYYG